MQDLWDIIAPAPTASLASIALPITAQLCLPPRPLQRVLEEKAVAAVAVAVALEQQCIILLPLLLSLRTQ